MNIIINEKNFENNNLTIIDNKLTDTINTSSIIIKELSEQNDKINKINNNLNHINESINISKTIYKRMSSWLYKLDYFDLYKKYLEYTTTNLNIEENIELQNLKNNILENNILYNNTNIIETEDKILNKLSLLKLHSEVINKTLDIQNDNIVLINNTIDNIDIKFIQS